MSKKEKGKSKKRFRISEFGWFGKLTTSFGWWKKSRGAGEKKIADDELRISDLKRTVGSR